ncbi:MAG: TraR/DksA C4-type zinc finger protein [Desulfohalobiaceae bacterium]|nr:TraR/DksA C4-type zinc finger protein [Desulfohalobiaceae bacterium]
MEEQAKNEIRRAVGKQIQDLTQGLSEFEERAQTVNLYQPIGRLSRIDSLTNQGILLSGISKSKARLTALQRTLQDIDDPEFGHCLECGQDINPKRLIALPESRLCISCAQ